MKLLKNPVLAFMLALLIVVSSTLVNVHVKYGRICRDVSETFYAENGIADHLSSIRMDAAVLVSVAESNGIDAGDLGEAANNLQSMLSRNTSSAGTLFRCYDQLCLELIGVEQKLLGLALNDTDAKTVSDCLARIQDAKNAIAASPYNNTVRAFLIKDARFPTHLLARLADVDIPEVFA